MLYNSRMRTALALALSLAASVAAADGAAVPAPEVHVGDRWTYQLKDWYGDKVTAVYDLKTTFVGAHAISAVSTLKGSRAEIDTIWTPEWNAVTDQRGGAFLPNSGWLRFPLVPGARYKSQFDLRRPRDGFFASLKIDVAVVGWEEVQVPAGTFRALKVDASGPVEAVDNFGGGGTAHYVIWYVPEVRRWVKWTFDAMNPRGQTQRHDSEELVGYHLE